MRLRSELPHSHIRRSSCSKDAPVRYVGLARQLDLFGYRGKEEFSVDPEGSEGSLKSRGMLA